MRSLTPSPDHGNERWRDFFARHATVVLVANSDAVDTASLRRRFADDALFVFFNKAFKILDRPFDGESLLVARSSPAGANIVYRREVGGVLSLLKGPGFHGVLNLKAGAAEAFSPASAFEGANVGYLDLSGHFAGFYPSTHLPTSGFALALWLTEQKLSTRIVLAGFTARRSAAWKLFHDHDWTFEQIVQRLLVRKGRLHLAEGAPPDQILAVICERLEGVTPGEVSLAAAEVLSERLEGLNQTIDSLLSVTRAQRAIDAFLRRLKPKTRKRRQAEKSGAGSG